ncbi:MAG TPA: hypothetical protein VFS40_13095 [Gemmatimonadales bacterium]|nr:hypothetical protein [Gemmatimonadales bacterium]
MRGGARARTRPVMLAVAAVAALGGVGLACRGTGTPGDAAADSAQAQLLATRLARTTARLDSTRLGSARADSAPIARWLLPEALNEISGLALTRDGRLLAHGDERAVVYELDYRRGLITRSFTVGDPAVTGDFEGIAVVGDSLVLATSAGVLYVFAEGADGAHVGYRTLDTGLGHACELEGLAYDATRRALLLGCKQPGAALEGRGTLLFRVPFGPGTAATGGAAQAERVALDPAHLPAAWKGFHPSAVEVHPVRGTYVLVAGIEGTLVEVTPAGALVRAGPLPGAHAQPEGVALTADPALLVADEAKNGAAVVTLYPYPR